MSKHNDFASDTSKKLLRYSYRLAHWAAEKILVAAKVKAAGLLAIPLAIIILMLFGSLLGVAFVGATLTLKAAEPEQQALSDYLAELDLATVEQMRVLAQGYQEASMAVKFRINGQEREAENLGLQAVVSDYLVYFDYHFADYVFPLIKDSVRALYIKLNRVQTIDEGEQVVIALSSKSLPEYLQEETASSDRQKAQQASETLSLMQMMSEAGSLGQILGNPFADTKQRWHVSSHYGHRLHPKKGYAQLHTGVDIPQPANTPVQAVLAGRARVGNFDPHGYGNWVIISSGDVQIYYAHLSAVLVTDEQEVSLGEVIGLVGSTGDSTGNHLHLEYRRFGKSQDPYPLLRNYP